MRGFIFVITKQNKISLIENYVFAIMTFTTRWCCGLAILGRLVKGWAVCSHLNEFFLIKTFIHN